MKNVQQEPTTSYIPIQRLTDPQPIRATCFHPSGETYVVGSNSKALRICKYPDLETRSILINESIESNSNESLCSEQLRLPLAFEPEILFTCLHIHCGSVYCTAFNQSGNLLATGSNDQIVHIIRYNADRHEPDGSEYKLAIHSGTVRDVCFLAQPAPKSDEWAQSPSQQTTTNLLASAGAGEYEVNVSDCNQMKCINSFRGHEGPVMSLHCSPNSSDTFVSGSQDGTIRLWDLRCKSSVSIITPVGAPKPVSPGGDTVIVRRSGMKQEKRQDPDESLEFRTPNGDEKRASFDIKQEQENLAPQNPHGDLQVANDVDIEQATKSTSVDCVRLDPTGRMLASGQQDGSCMLYDIRAGKVIQLFQAHGDEIRTLNFSPKTYYLLTGSYDRKIKLIDLQGHLSSKLPIVELAELGDKCIQTAWHPQDYNFVTTCANGSATLWTIPNFDEWINSTTSLN